jgi:hypothetical protein
MIYRWCQFLKRKALEDVMPVSLPEVSLPPLFRQIKV